MSMPSIRVLIPSYRLVSTTRTCMILSDMIVVAVTWFHTYKTRKAAQAANIQSSVANLLLRDGTFYFVILALLNATHMSLAITGVFTFLTVFSVPISSIIISRFLLNLRQVDASRRDANWSMPSYVASTTSGATGTFPRGDFVSFLTGNMGKSLDHNPQDELTELDEEFSSGRHYPATPPATPSEC
ncbi:hypothetical protein CERSUDRAFT_96139 [Gelatoporia subvermispora B]|uniref:Uncharacterized protein n=1 Tax=Ceriporiopsis subvermispora (strain B) TaxID=914234 RepID=M2QFV7_CERS8|nr:hypothetical protein CERSUDRAFT_96139 [Gelatoporia subvermispora B]